MKKICIYLMGAMMVVALSLVVAVPDALAQCAGQTRCGSFNIQTNSCDVEHDFTTGCGGGCSPDGCGGCQITSSCTGGTGGGGWTCFAAGTKVSMVGNGVNEANEANEENEVTEKNIEDVVVGDKVVSQDEAGQRSVSTVTQLDQPIREHMCRVEFADDREDDNPPLRMTNEHPIMTSEGWKSITPSKTAEENPDLRVASLIVGDKVVREDGGVYSAMFAMHWSEMTT